MHCRSRAASSQAVAFSNLPCLFRGVSKCGTTLQVGNVRDIALVLVAVKDVDVIVLLLGFIVSSFPRPGIRLAAAPSVVGHIAICAGWDSAASRARIPLVRPRLKPTKGRGAMNRHRISARSGFTYRDLLLVIIVVGVLLALFPRRAIGPRGGPANALRQQSEADRFGPAQLCHGEQGLPAGHDLLHRPRPAVESVRCLGRGGPDGAGLSRHKLSAGASCPIGDKTRRQGWNYRCGSPAPPYCKASSNSALANGHKGSTARLGATFVRAWTTRDAFDLWTGGGTDYGGCAGRHAAFTLKTGYNLCDATMYYEPSFFPSPVQGKGRRHADETLGHLRPGERRHQVQGSHRRPIEHHHDRRVAADHRHDARQQGRLGDRRAGDAFTTGAMFRRSGTTRTNWRRPSKAAR